MNRRQFRPEGPSGTVLESRALLSTVSASMVAIQSSTKTITGAERGTYTEKSIADAGSTFNLSGAGKIAGIGTARFSASLQSLGLIATGHSSGTATIATKGGTIHLALTGPTQTGGSALPTHYTMTVTGGTGKYAHATGSGTADFTVTPVGKTTGLASHGKFTVHYTTSLTV